jgi:hypothetical protein
MKYAILIYGDEKAAEKMTQADGEKVMSEYMQYTQDLIKADVMKGGSPLKPVATATSLRTKGGKIVPTDGPFAETKEQLGGFYLIEAPDLEKALDWARKCPGVKNGTLEVRPVMEIPGM